MFKIALMKFESNLAVSIDGAKRQTFKKGEKVIVGKGDILMLMRLGCTLVNERMLNFKEHKDLFKVTKADIKKGNDEFEKVCENKTLDQLKEFVDAIKFTKDCDEAYCTDFAIDLLVDREKEAEDKIQADKDAEEKKEKEKQEKIDKEKADAKKLDEDKKASREKAEKEAKEKQDKIDKEKSDKDAEAKKKKEDSEKAEKDAKDKKAKEDADADAKKAEKDAKDKKAKADKLAENTAK